jgi:hypothetical protein
MKHSPNDEPSSQELLEFFGFLLLLVFLFAVVVVWVFLL